MDIASQLTSGRRPQVPILLLYGKHGTGKTCLAAGAPGAFIIRAEDGTEGLDILRYPLDVAEGGPGKVQTFNELIAVLDWVLTDTETAPRIQTVILDSLTAIERLVVSFTCALHNVSNIEEVGGGYGKGYTAALDQWGTLLHRLELLRASGRACILISHCETIRIEDPTMESFDMAMPQLHKKARALMMQEANAILYLAQEAITTKEDLGFNKTRAREVGQVKRKVYCARGAGFEAKNRMGLPFCIDIPDDHANPLGGWAHIAAALASAQAGTPATTPVA